jgi:N-acetylglucosaminyldiphosphoundecaprenol N-acetyl-beta-D-mannosaminyltransferase
MSTAYAFPTFEIKGVSVAAVNLAFAADFICKRAVDAHGQYVTVTDAHGIVESVYDERIRTAYRQAIMAVPDGMPLVWLGRLIGSRSIGRVYGPDLMESIFANKEHRQLKHFFYGANPTVLLRLSERLRARFGEFNLIGTYSPPIQPLGFVEQDDVIAGIRDLKPDLIWVSLSAPKQELWMQMHMPMIGYGLAIGVGAAFDLLSGTTAQAPRWMQRSGLEWLFRVTTEPKRLFKRYLFVVPRFLCFFMEKLTKHWTELWRGRGAPTPI